MAEESMEMISFGIVAAAGQARSMAMEAIKTAREGDIEAARKMLEESREAGGDHVPVDILLVHSQDHLMTAMLCQDLAEEIINLYETKADK